MTDQKVNDGDVYLTKIRTAMRGVHGARLEIVPLLFGGKGSAVQVYEASLGSGGRLRYKKCGPLIIPGEDQAVADILHMLGVLSTEAAS